MIGDHFLKTFAPEVPYENTLKVVLEVQVWLLLFDFLGVVVVLLGGGEYFLYYYLSFFTTDNWSYWHIVAIGKAYLLPKKEAKMNMNHLWILPKTDKKTCYLVLLL